MKYLLGAFCLSFSLSAFATVDAVTEVSLVVQNIQEENDFTVMEAPIVGCYGLAQGPQLAQWTAPYEVPSNVGCGGTPHKENINALTCAKVISATEAPDYISFSKIVLDISACPHKDNSRFITMVRTSAARNFPQTGKNKGKDVELVLVK